MNPRWPTMCALLLAVAGCATHNDEPAASAVSFSAVPSASARSSAAPEGSVELAAAGTVCGSVATAQDAASVVIRSGSANCVQVLRAARAYAAAASHADGQPVVLETGGWRCAATTAAAAATCRAGDADFSVG
ncbi:hypothetical protein [Tsukamurella sp. NPDC003166]|uniref:hypothetical protein n=1 Tax=Tsukamurella sp. NPDC003166 TaxID=3154444 RepID=UPI0033B0C094